MLFNRVIPCLLLKNRGLVKTIQFKDPVYVGDPINAVKIFNEKEVDEIVLLDITASQQRRGPDFDLIGDIASECFMPLAYGGGIRTQEEIARLFSLGVEKASINSQALDNPGLIQEASRAFGAQSIVVSIDVKKKPLAGYRVYNSARDEFSALDPVEYAKQMEGQGAGEIFLNSVDRDGTMRGYDLDLIKKISDAVTIPVIACGGAGSLNDFELAIKKGNAAAVAAGSMFVFQGKYRAVLINYPQRQDLEKVLA